MTSYAPGRGLAGVRLLALGLLAIALSFVACGPRQITASPPTQPLPVASAKVRLATYNAIISEANKAAADAVDAATDAGLLQVHLSQDIIAWQKKVARVNKTLALALSDETADVKSEAITKVVVELAAPPLLNRWMGALTKPEQQLLVSAIQSLATTIAMVLREFGPKSITGELVTPMPSPCRSLKDANTWAYSQAVAAERVLGIFPTGIYQRSAAMELAGLWLMQGGRR